jgi:hypothetical protein
MAVHAYLLAVLVVSSLGGAGEFPSQAPQDMLISAHRVLADVRQVHVVLAMQAPREVEGLVDAPALTAQVLQKLAEAGITTLERDAETTQKLIVHIDGVEVPGSDRCVHRIQTALGRLVTVPGLGNHQVQAEVWRVRPVMDVAAKAEAGKAISAAVLIQVDAFVNACKAGRSLRDVTEDTGTAGPAHLYTASKSSSVFHRADCRWAQNISADNLVGYTTREEALQSGKRPCKSCQP